MMTEEEIILIAVASGGGLLIGALIGFLIAYISGSNRRKELEAKIAVQSDNLGMLARDFDRVQHDLVSVRDDHHALQLNAKEKEVNFNNLQSIYLKNIEKLRIVEASSDEAKKNLSKAKEALASTRSTLEAEQNKSDQCVKKLAELDQELRRQVALVDKERENSSVIDKRAKGFEISEKEVREQLAELKFKLEAEVSKTETLLEKNQMLDKDSAKLLKAMEEREASHARELANFEQQKRSLAEQFKVLSSEILDAKTKSLQENNQMTMGAIMNPFQKSIDSFKKEVQEIHHRETTQQGELRKELESLKDLNQKMTMEAHELSTALRGQKKLQGNWGELVLENVLERSGLQPGKDYKREVSIATEEGRFRPDAIIYLPQGKHLVVDAKVSLNAYTRYVNSDDESARALALKEHVEAVRARIKELSNKDYYKLPGLNSPDMVFMFVPIESAFVEALKADEKLFQSAIENNVLVATPTTLLTSLNIVRQLWRYEDQNKHTAALAKKADGVFKKLNSFLGSFENIKKNLDRANEAYVRAEGQLVSGKANLVKQVGEFKNLAPTIKAELPNYFTEKADLEIDFIPVEPSSSESSEEPQE